MQSDLDDDESALASYRLALEPYDADAAMLPATVSAVQPLGAETLLVVDVPESGEMIARLNRDVSVRPGDAVGLRFDPDAVRLFDPETTRAIPPQGSTREEIP